MADPELANGAEAERCPKIFLERGYPLPRIFFDFESQIVEF